MISFKNATVIVKEKGSNSYILESLRVGMRFSGGRFGHKEVMLAQVGPSQVSLICLRGGNRLSDPPVSVGGAYNLTGEEARKLFGDTRDWKFLAHPERE